MKKVAVVYYSGTGNTEAMASIIRDSLKGKADGSLIECTSFSPSMVNEYDAFAFGCPAMGNEELEEESFEPMFTQLEPSLSGKDVVLFGSYGWGDGEWMRSWTERCIADSVNLKCESVICLEAPDGETEKALQVEAEALIA